MKISLKTKNKPMLYTRKGDKGDTYFFGCKQRFMKSSELAEALGALDEINSFLGYCKIKADQLDSKYRVNNSHLADILARAQENLFIIQAALAGADKKIAKEKIDEAEKIIDAIEKELPEIKTFFVAGGTELASLLDYSRTIARRAERRVVAVSEKDKVALEILSYLNRLSSLLYALARYVNFKAGASEQPPSYR